MDHEISLHALQEKLKELSPDSAANDFCLLDVREPWESSMGVIPGSRLIPMGDLPSCAHQELNPETHIVVYCHHGMRSLSVVMWLREQGFERAQSLSGGIDAWSQQVDPSISRY